MKRTQAMFTMALHSETLFEKLRSVYVDAL